MATYCGARHPGDAHAGRPGALLCQLPPGHDGPHQAHMVVRWTTEAALAPGGGT